MFKPTGVVRRIDDLGRIVVPAETRRIFNINNGDPIEFFVDERGIIIRKYVPGCNLCNEVKDKYIEFRGNRICSDCASEISNK